MQALLSRVFAQSAAIEVVGRAGDARDALEKIELLSPHVVTMDVKLPGMDGLEALRLIRERRPHVRVVMCSSDTARGAKATLDALFAGASHCVAKPGGEESGVEFAVFAEEITRKVCLHRTRSATASGSHFVPSPGNRETSQSGIHLASASRGQRGVVVMRTRPQVLAIGSSTGGPAALAEILPLLPAGFSLPVLIVQHMPPLFTKQLAERLSRLSRIPVVEGVHGMEVKAGVAIIAPGDYHMRVVRKAGRVEVVLTQEEPENSCRPAVDVLFRSVAEAYGGCAIAAVLTGMGQDGLQGANSLKALGNPVVAQDQATSVVWGMPKAIVEAGLADAVLPLNQIIPEIMRYL
jgi:two-component system chemotaxis response regulator CheB